MDFDSNKNYKKWFKNSWSYVIGAILLSVVQIFTLIITGNPWGITGSYAYWSGRVIEALGGSLSYQPYVNAENIPSVNNVWFLQDPVALRNIGIIMGAMLAALLASQFRIKKIKSKKQIVAAAVGGLLMGYGSSIAAGCNIGAFYSGISSMSLSGWIFGLFLFVGAIVGGKLLIRFFM